MFVIIGLVIVVASVLGGFLLEHGQFSVLIQPTEFLILGGAGIGSMVMANPPAVLKGAISQLIGLLKPNPFGGKAYGELLQVLYEIFQKARKDGLVGLEAHIEDPANSDIFQKYPSFAHNHHAVSLLCDTLKVLLTGTVEDHNLAEILDIDLEKHHHAQMHVPHAVSAVSDAMPGFGIVAAVLGVIITMGHIGGEASEIGKSVAAALVGTFLGILLAYGVLGPIAKSMENRIIAENDYMLCVRTALLAFARGDAPMTAVEFARRNVDPHERPSFSELEALTRNKAA
ncbi:MAG: flagellar motor stator protein MotA [Gemmatimonadota bacterium]|nr:flagellar motor stator protein MotA [Gemmatimonadota bacterium]